MAELVTWRVLQSSVTNVHANTKVLKTMAPSQYTCITVYNLKLYFHCASLCTLLIIYVYTWVAVCTHLCSGLYYCSLQGLFKIPLVPMCSHKVVPTLTLNVAPFHGQMPILIWAWPTHAMVMNFSKQQARALPLPPERIVQLWEQLPAHVYSLPCIMHHRTFSQKIASKHGCCTPALEKLSPKRELQNLSLVSILPTNFRVRYLVI